MSLATSLELKWLDPADVEPNPANWRLHPSAQSAALTASLDAAGWAGAALYNKRTARLIDGHLRQKQAKARGELLPVLVGEWTEEQERLILATLDPIAGLAEADDTALECLLAELRADVRGGRLEFDEGQLEALIADLNATGGPAAPRSGLLPGVDPDAVPERAPERCRSGDLWSLGDHRLLCGDSTRAEDVGRLMGGERAALCLTDPPYGVGVEYESTEDSEANLCRLVDGFLPLARERASFVLLTPGTKNHRCYPRPDWCMAWFVPAGAGVNSHGFTCWHPVLAYGADPYLASGLGSRPDALCKTETSPDVAHPCPKPVEVWKWWMERGSVKACDAVYDPFLGSGTTLIAAECLGRRCFGMEIEARYVDVALARWEKATGREAVLIERVSDATA